MTRRAVGGTMMAIGLIAMGVSLAHRVVLIKNRPSHPVPSLGFVHQLMNGAVEVYVTPNEYAFQLGISVGGALLTVAGAVVKGQGGRRQ